MSSERRSTKLDFRTGKVTSRSARTSAETVEERFAGVMAEAEEQMGETPIVQVLSVMCDGCGWRQVVERPELPAGWTTNERGEFCPNCS